MTIRDWPINERPREKLLSQGAQSLSDAELLAIFLRTGIKGKTAVDLARDLLKSFQGLRNLLLANFDQLNQHKGLGKTKYAELQAVLEMSRRHLQSSLSKKDLIRHSDDTKRFLMAQLRDLEHEVFACLYLNSKHQIICFEELFKGSLNSANIYPRELIKRALHHNAASIILAHNHPSGDPTPSQSDIQITQQLTAALDTISIDIIDHIVIGDGEILSFAEQGLL